MIVRASKSLIPPKSNKFLAKNFAMLLFQADSIPRVDIIFDKLILIPFQLFIVFRLSYRNSISKP